MTCGIVGAKLNLVCGRLANMEIAVHAVSDPPLNLPGDPRVVQLDALPRIGETLICELPGSEFTAWLVVEAIHRVEPDDGGPEVLLFCRPKEWSESGLVVRLQGHVTAGPR